MPPPQRYQHYNDVDVHVHVHRRHDSPPLPPKPNPKILPILLKVIIMTLITSMFFLLLGLVAFLLLPILFTSLNRHHDRHRGACHSDGLSPKELKSLSQFKVSKRNESQPGFESECVVCLEGFKQGQWCRKLVGCGHVFHRRCLDTWLLKVAACPTCRTPTTFDRFLRNSFYSIWEN
ncbi:hypothetical protein AB3S75_020913 [Citrus x aurantiifolia]